MKVGGNKSVVCEKAVFGRRFFNNDSVISLISLLCTVSSVSSLPPAIPEPVRAAGGGASSLHPPVLPAERGGQRGAD